MPKTTFDLEPNITYKTPDRGKALKVDLFRPKGTLKAIMLYAHGGGFTKGSRKDKTARRLATKLAKNGVAVASVDYRLKTDLSTFTPDRQNAITTAQKRTARVGMTLAPRLCGPHFYASLEDLSDAVAYLRTPDGPLGAKPVPLLALGVSSGGIAALSLAFPPRNGWETVNRPDAVIGISAAMIQPWRLAQDGIPSVLFCSYQDKVIGPENAQFTEHRATTTSAPLQVITTQTRGHNPQVDLFIDGDDPDGKPWLDLARQMMRLK
jgi:acetyl esterase/lipase